MEELKGRCRTNDSLKKKYKLVSPISCTSDQITTYPSIQSISMIKKDLFQSSSSSTTMDPTIENEDAEDSIDLPDFSASGVGENVQTKEASDLQLIEEESNEDDLSNVYMDIVEEQATSKLTEENVKKYYCPYCRTLYKQLARHLFQVHSGEEEVGAIINLDKKDPEKRRVLASLRAKGSKIYNALQTSPSKVIVPRKKKTFSIEEYIPCYLCGNMYKRKFLHRHMKICPNNRNEPTRRALKTAEEHKYVEEGNGGEDIKFSKDIISGMREGDVKVEIQRDPLLVSYGKFMCSYYGTDKHLINLIRRKLRQVTEVLLEMKKNDNDVMSLRDIFQASKKQVLFNAIKKVTGFNKGSFKRPAMANEMATLLKQCAKRYITEAQELDRGEDVKKARNWIAVITEDYNAYIGKHARKTLDTNQWNRPKVLPLTEDVMKLNEHVNNVTEEASRTLKKEFSFPHWTNFNKATMVKLLLFNRKRVGDVKRITIDDFKKSHNVQKGSVTYQMLSESEKILCSQYKRLQARGKRGKGVSMLLTKDMMRAVEIILGMREKAGISPNNPYVFAKTNEAEFQAHLALKDMVYDCKALFPQYITGTSLRREIATATQAFNFSHNDMTILANFLGHTLQTHSTFYRLPDEAVQLAKISAVLQAIDSGKVAELKGKSLDELNVFVETFINEQNKAAEQGENDPEPSSSLQPSTPRKPVKILRKTWTTPEKTVMKKQFKRHLENETLPTPLECYEAKNKFSPLKCRTVAQIKAWVYNQNNRKKKLAKDNTV